MLLVGAAFASDSWTTVTTGVRLLERTASGPERIHAVEVDLCADGISLRASTSGERGQTVSSFARDVGAVAAINGDFFSYDDYSTSGLAVGNGTAWSDDSSTEGFVAFGDDRAWISPPSEVWSTPADWMDEAVGGRPLLVEDGAPVGSYSTPSSCPDRNPHTAVGLSRDRQTLWLVVIDGRSSASVGMTCAEEADLLADLGAWTALSLDGGGSSTLWVDGDVVNDPSDGSERVVGNHLGVIAGSGAPGSCDWTQAAPVLDAADDDPHPTDVNADGRADVCGRGPDGFACALATDGGFGDTWSIATLADGNGWADPSNYDGIRMADVDGDGRADVCARADLGMRCFLAQDGGFASAFAGPDDLDDAGGWDDPAYGTTIRFADVTGDGRDDLCARGAAGFRCWPSLGTAFDAEIDPVALTDDNGWGLPEYYGTIRTGDVDGDGRDDVCARASSGMLCWLADGTGFPTRVEGPAWSDAAGWDDVSAWSTIRLVDLDGDGRTDLCGRGPDGAQCALSTGAGFGAVFSGPTLSDASGWGDHANYATIRFGDVDGDGDQDLCARANAGVYCWLYADGAFATRIDGPALSDDSGWTRARYYATLRMGDLDGDGRADLCARAAAGMRCYRSTGAGFEAAIVGPEWSDAAGWDDLSAYSTLRFGGGGPVVSGEDTGTGDTGRTVGDSGNRGDTGGDPTGDTAPEVGAARVVPGKGCGAGAAWVLAVPVLVGRRRR